MCGRFTSLTPPDELASVFGAAVVDEVRAETFVPNFNVAPSTMILAVAWTQHSGRRLGRLKWGLVPEWSRSAPGTGHINARSETVSIKPSFRDSFAKRRCIVPMSGYYEWRTVGLDDSSETRPRKRAVYVTRRDGRPLAVAGLWSSWNSSGSLTDGARAEVVKSCCVITREADAMLATVHDRMPLILGPSDWSAWLGEKDCDDEMLSALLTRTPGSDELTIVDVGSNVNNVRNNGPELIEPVHD